MNIYEAMKLADEWRVMWDTDKFPDNKPMSITEMNRREAVNTSVNKHCRKNFMEMLEALKRISENAGDSRGRDGAYLNDGLYALIVKMENVMTGYMR